MNKVLIPLLVVSLVGNTYLFFQIQKNDKSIEASQVKVSTKADGAIASKDIKQDKSDQVAIIQDLSEKLTNLRVSLANLEKENQELVAKLKRKRLKASELAQRDNLDIPESDSKAKIDKSKLSAEEMMAEQERTIERFNNEEVNQRWAYPIQDDLNDVISESELLARMSINDITCKTTSCRVSIKPLQEGMGARIGAYFELSQTLRENEQFKDYITSSHHDDTTKDVYVYITRADSEG